MFQKSLGQTEVIQLLHKSTYFFQQNQNLYVLCAVGSKTVLGEAQ